MPEDGTARTTRPRTPASLGVTLLHAWRRVRGVLQDSSTTRAPRARLAALIGDLTPAPTSKDFNARSLLNLIGQVVPSDHCEQASAEELLARIVPRQGDGTFVDLGCGRGGTRELVEAYNARIRWVGIEIEDSPNLTGDSRLPTGVITYDGVSLPLSDSSADMIYSKQVFEHVRHPEMLLSEVRRVLKPGGHFFGSVSGLEPYHYYSLFNFTPYGFFTIVNDSGLTPVEFRPGVDGLTLSMRHFSSDKKVMRGPGPAPMNQAVDRALKLLGESVRETNIRKLMYAGHIVFVARKDER